jgi:hypothetical protein
VPRNAHILREPPPITTFVAPLRKAWSGWGFDLLQNSNTIALVYASLGEAKAERAKMIKQVQCYTISNAALFEAIRNAILDAAANHNENIEAGGSLTD